MLLETKPQLFNNKFLPLILAYAVFVIPFYSPIAESTTLVGPTDLSSQEFKELNIHGPSKLSEIKADSLRINGPLNFNQLKVKGKTEISGPTSGEEGEFKDLLIHGTFWGNKIKIENLQVDGDVTIEHFNINGDVNINGPLKAKNGTFSNITNVYAPVALYNVVVNNIYIKKDSNQNHKESDQNNNAQNEVKLAGETIVSGNITFESGDGVVFIRDKTSQLKGKVIGGKIKEQ